MAIKSFDEFCIKHDNWASKLKELRNIALECGLEEAIKWGMPHYCKDNKNIVGIGAFKNHIGLWFHQGSFLKDPKKVLRNAQEGKTKGMRGWRITADQNIDSKTVKAYIKEAITNHDNGLRIKVERKKKVPLPDELKGALKEDKKLLASWEALTPGKKNEYAEHIASAKQERTRVKRLATAIPLIKKGVGINDKYKK